MDCVNRDMKAIETTKDEVHDITCWRRIVSATAAPQLSRSGLKNNNMGAAKRSRLSRYTMIMTHSLLFIIYLAIFRYVLENKIIKTYMEQLTCRQLRIAT